MAGTDILLPKRFEVLRELGSGGTSVVYHARDRESGREVAVKVLTKDRLEDRFHAEAERLSQLSHPNLVEFLEVGKHEGHDYLVMEFLAGGELASYLRGKGSEDILRVFIAICAGLGYLHAQGIVHRDVKPANILLDALGTPKLTDLGSARQVDRTTRITKAGSILGTYAYLAPEQIQSLDAGPAADLYSLGVCLFEALTGRRPFTAKNEFQLMKAHLEEAPPSLHKFRPELPDSLENLIASLLEKQPEVRPTTAAVVAGMLSRCLADLQSRAKRQLVENDPEQAIESLPEAQRSTLMAVGYLGERATFAEVCGISSFAEDKTDSLLEALVEAKLLTCPESDTFVLTVPRRLVLNRFTPRVRDLFEARLARAGHGFPSSSGMTTAGISQSGRTRDGLTPTPDPGAGPPTITGRPKRPRGVRQRRVLHLSGLLALAVLATAGLIWSRSGQLVVASLPGQASVLLDGEWRGETPLRLNGLLPGKHTVRLILDGHVSEVREVELAAGRPVPLDFTLTLKESRGALTVAGLPEGAQVTINGAIYDPGALAELSFPAGKARVKVVRSGYRTFFQEIDVRAGEAALVQVEMSPIEGVLACTSEPGGAVVMVDGKECGVTPVTLEALSAGEHRVEMFLDGYPRFAQSIEVKDEAVQALHAALATATSSPTPAASPTPAPVASPATPSLPI